MEADKKTNRIEHQQYTIQYNDKAISDLKYNKRISKRQRIKVRFKNGPKGISLRWTPKTNKKVFQLIFAFRGKSLLLDCGEFLPGSFECNDLDGYLLKLNEKHRNKDGTFKTNPNVDVITQKSLKKSQLKTLGQVIELICKDNFPRRNITGKLSALSQKDHTRFLIGYNKRREHITFQDDDKGWGQILFKDKSTIKDWDSLFKTYPRETGCYEGNEKSIYDSYLGKVIIDDLLPGNIEIYLNEIERSYGQKENIRKALACLWGYARDKGFMGPNPPLNPTRKEKGGITIKKTEQSIWVGSKYNDFAYDLEELKEIKTALVSLRDRFPFQSECLSLMLNTGMRAEECKKLTKEMLTTDKNDNPIISMKRYITKGRTNQRQKDIAYDITEPVQEVLDSLKYQLEKPKFNAYQFVPWLFPTTRISLEKLSDPDRYPNYARSNSCRIHTLDDTWNAVREMTGLKGSIKSLRKSFVNITNDTLGGAHKGKHISKHKNEFTNSGTYDKASRKKTTDMAKRVGKVLMFKTNAK
jgi:integrase